MVPPGTFFIFFLFMCFASSHYYSSTKHFISLLAKTTPRDRFLSGLWKIFQTTQSHPSDFSQLSYYKTKIVQTRFLYTEVHYSDFRWKDLGPSASTMETSAFRFGGAIFIPQIITKIGVVRKVHYFLPPFSLLQPCCSDFLLSIKYNLVILSLTCHRLLMLYLYTC